MVAKAATETNDTTTSGTSEGTMPRPASIAEKAKGAKAAENCRAEVAHPTIAP